MIRKKVFGFLIGLAVLGCVGSEELLVGEANAQNRGFGRSAGVRIYSSPGYSGYRSGRSYNYGYVRPYSGNVYSRPYGYQYRQPYYGNGYQSSYRPYYSPNYNYGGVPYYGLGNGVQIQIGGRVY